VFKIIALVKLQFTAITTGFGDVKLLKVKSLFFSFLFFCALQVQSLGLGKVKKTFFVPLIKQGFELEIFIITTLCLA